MGTRLFHSPFMVYNKKVAGVAKLADALDLGSSAARHGGSSPFARTNEKPVVKDNRFFALGLLLPDQELDSSPSIQDSDAA